MQQQNKEKNLIVEVAVVEEDVWKPKMQKTLKYKQIYNLL